MLSLLCGCVAAKLAAQATIAYRVPNPAHLAAGEPLDLVQVAAPQSPREQADEPTRSIAAEPTVLVATTVGQTLPALRQ